MKLLVGLCALSCLGSVIFASEHQKDQVDSKQEKRSLSHDEWSSSGLESGQILSAGLGAGVFPGTVGVSSHTDTLTTVREKVPVPFEVIKTV